MDINKFNFKEIFNNKNGKTSASSFSGTILVLAGLATFILGTIDKIWITKTTEVLTNSIEVILIGASLLGIRKWRETQVKKEEEK